METQLRLLYLPPTPHLHLLDNNTSSVPDIDLPYGDKFTPGSLDTPDEYGTELAAILEIASGAESPGSLEDELMDRFEMSRGLAENCRRSVASYGIIAAPGDPTLTDLGEALYEVRTAEEDLYDRFAEHILLEKHGLLVLREISSLQAEGQPTTSESIIRTLNYRTDIYAGTPDANHMGYMRQWLEKADLIAGSANSYTINWTKVAALTGASEDDIDVLESLTHSQRVFLLTLARLNPSSPVDPADVRTVAESVFETALPYKQFSDEVLDPLEEEGYIDREMGTRGAGEISMSDDGVSEVVIPIIEMIERRKDIPGEILRTSYDDILDEIHADDDYIRGEALEKLAIKIGRLLDLEFRGWRERSADTGHSEVDVIFDSTTTTFERWQIQCKNPREDDKAAVTSRTVAREVGIACRLYSDVILMITTGRISDGAQSLARQLSANTNLSILFLDNAVINDFQGNPDEIVESLEKQAQQIRELHRLDIDGPYERYRGEGNRIAKGSRELEELVDSVITDGVE